MAKRLLNETEYIDEMNRKLKDHPAYQEGLMFMAYPSGSVGGEVTGIAVAGVGYNQAYMDITNAMHEEYEVALTHRPYRGFQRQVE